MHHDMLESSINATHEVLAMRLSLAADRLPTRDKPRDRYPATDNFLASTSRHLAAVNATLVPAARKLLADGSERAHAFSRQSRHLERALAQTKAKLYGEAHAIHRTWAEIWDDVRREFEATLAMEHQLAVDLLPLTDDTTRSDLADRIYRAELRSPTRPHPYVPHLGVPGRMARRVCRQVDRFWDSTEGRMIPEPVRIHDRQHQGRLTQYLLADPHMHKDVEPH